MANNPPWLRGPVAGVIPLLQPVAHSLIDCQEDVQTRLIGVTAERIWTKPGNAASIGFHVRHAIGSLDRLFTYARGDSLTDAQLATLRTEGERGAGPDTAEELIAEFNRAVERSMTQVRGTRPEDLLQHRQVGRGKLPSNVLGLLFHAAEHTQRHIGQMTTTLRVVP
ncbi:MAG TPA: DinB family protein [Gemmatimonadaceae bacterium]|nr:DinB family protein [Gemmatimonadaceae bacterium]